MSIEKTVKNLEQRGFSTKLFKGKEEAATYLLSEIKGFTVGIGGSVTIDSLGIYEKLAESNTIYWHWKAPGRETQLHALTADVYLSSANAISEDGEIFNIDGTGNRIAATVFGHNKVYIIAGTNKICPDFDSALKRARDVAATKNCARFGLDTPCQLDGKCHDCRHPKRICRALTVLWEPMNGMETEVVLIDEPLGF